MKIVREKGEHRAQLKDVKRGQLFGFLPGDNIYMMMDYPVDVGYTMVDLGTGSPRNIPLHNGDIQVIPIYGVLHVTEGSFDEQ